VEREGRGTGGTIVPVLVSNAVLMDAKEMIRATVHAIAGVSAPVAELEEWDRRWELIDRYMEPVR
jgi:hypothetical protein